MLTFLLVIVGALNWGLIGFFDFNLVASLGLSEQLENLVYMAVGASAVYEIVTHPQSCKECSAKSGGKKK